MSTLRDPKMSDEIDGCDGDVVIDKVVELARDMNWNHVVFKPGGKIVTNGYRITWCSADLRSMDGWNLADIIKSAGSR